MKNHLKVASFIGLFIAFPALIIRSVTLGTASLTIAALVFTAAICAIAVLAF